MHSDEFGFKVSGDIAFKQRALLKLELVVPAAVKGQLCFSVQ